MNYYVFYLALLSRTIFFKCVAGTLCCGTAQSPFVLFQTQSQFNLQNEVSYRAVVSPPGSLCPPAFLYPHFIKWSFCAVCRWPVPSTCSGHCVPSSPSSSFCPLTPCYSTRQQNASVSSRPTGLKEAGRRLDTCLKNIISQRSPNMKKFRVLPTQLAPG